MPSTETAEEQRCVALAAKLRARALQMVTKAKSSHIGGSLSMADLLAALYESVLRVDPKRPDWPRRDRFILSKGHACAAFYAALAFKGFFPEDWLDGFFQDGGRLAGHATHTGVPGVEFSTGSLGHGLPVATGMALSDKRSKLDRRVFAILSDGECDEGSVWEAALFAGHHGLDNLNVIVDYNKIQSLGRVEDVLDLEPLADKWRAFGWSVRELDGHKMREILPALKALPFEKGKPSCVIAHTVKGKGVSFMEDTLLWHYRNPSAEELEKALAELRR
jgi:transketolase